MLLWDQLVEFLRLMIFAYAQACGGNLGSGIVAVSLLIRMSMLPLTVRIAKISRAHQQTMDKLKPELDRIRHRYRDRPGRIAQETQRLLEREGVSPFPLAGCLGGLIQLPVFLALCTAVRRCVLVGGRFLWMKDIAKPDVILALMVAAITYCSLLLATPSSTQGRPIVVMIPVIVTLVFLFKMSAGVALYCGVSAGVSLLQTFVVRRSAAA